MIVVGGAVNILAMVYNIYQFGIQTLLKIKMVFYFNG